MIFFLSFNCNTLKLTAFLTAFAGVIFLNLSKVHLVPLAVMALLFVFYAYFAFSIPMLNKMLALGAVVLIGLSFALGPLTRFFPKTFGFYLAWRKAIGLWGFAFAIVHALISLHVYYKWDFLAMLAFPSVKQFALLTGAAAIALFAVMARVSNKDWVARLGYEKWKGVLRIGYFALLLAIVHFYLIEIKDGVFTVRPAGWVVLLFAVAVIALRFAVLFKGMPEKQSFEEHVTPPQGLSK